MSRPRHVRWLALVAVLAVAVFYLTTRRGATGVKVSFRAVKVDRGPVEETVTATGALAAVVTVQVGSQVSGTIQKLGADFNSQVKEGQILAQLDPTRFRASLDQALAALKSAEAAAARARVNSHQARTEHARIKELAGKGVAGSAELDAAQSKVEQTEAEVAASDAQVLQARAAAGMARVDLERTTIRAPISGIVLSRAVDVGQTVAASLQAPTLFTLAQDLSQMEVKAAVDEADVGRLREGQEARFHVDAYPGQEFQARIFQIRSQPNVSQNVVTYDAILRVENRQGRLRPGMTATVRVVCQRREDVLRVPNAALRFKPAAELVEMSESAARATTGAPGVSPALARTPPRDAREAPGRAPGEGGGRAAARVYKASGAKLVPVPFRAGITDDEFTEIQSGALQAGDEVVIDVIGGPARQGPANNPMRGRGPRFF